SRSSAWPRSSERRWPGSFARHRSRSTAPPPSTRGSAGSFSPIPSSNSASGTGHRSGSTRRSRQTPRATGRWRATARGSRRTASTSRSSATISIPSTGTETRRRPAFPKTVGRAGVTDAEAVEQIDVGGPTMIRGAAKNHAHVLVVVDPDQYGEVLEALDRGQGAVPVLLARKFARRAFERTAAYDAAI